MLKASAFALDISKDALLMQLNKHAPYATTVNNSNNLDYQL